MGIIILKFALDHITIPHT